jgi:hypothetical protein
MRFFQEHFPEVTKPRANPKPEPGGHVHLALPWVAPPGLTYGDVPTPKLPI